MCGDARQLSELAEVADGSFDVVISLCQGAFGLTGGPGTSERTNQPSIGELDEPILSAMATAAKPTGWVVLSAFSSYFQIRHSDPNVPNAQAPDGSPPESFDATTGVNHEWTSVMNSEGVDEPAELWTTCYTPRELRLMARLVGLDPVAVHGVTPGHYDSAVPNLDCPEFLLLARPHSST